MNEPYDIDSTVGNLLGVLRRRWWAFLICLIAVPAAALALTVHQPKQYRATASLLFDQSIQQRALQAAPEAAVNPDRQAATDASLVKLDVVAAAAARRLPGLTPDEVRARVSVRTDKSDVIAVSATDTNPDRAARIAQAYARSYINLRRSGNRARLQAAHQIVMREYWGLRPAQRQGPVGDELRQSAQDLATLTALENGGAQLVQPAVPPASPFSPRPVRNALLGLLLGAALGFGLALLVDRADRRLRNREEIEELLGRPVLGTVPRSRALRRAKARPTLFAGEPGEALRALRANLRYLDLADEVRSVLFTSPVAGEGTTTVATQLAAAAAGAGQRVLLVEANLRRPSVAASLGFASASHDFVAALRGEVPIEDAIQSVAVAGSDELGGEGAVLDVVATARRPPNPQALLESPVAADLLAGAGDSYDLVLVDAAPVALVPDAFPLVTKVDGVVVVTRAKQTLRPAADRLRQRLDWLGARVLGAIIVGARDELGAEIRRELRPGSALARPAKVPVASGGRRGRRSRAP